MSEIKSLVKEMTVDDLADTTAKSFDKVEKSINKLEYRFDGLERRFDGFEKRMEDKFDLVLKKVDSLATSVEIGFKNVNNRIDNISLNYTTKYEHNLLMKRVGVIETKL